MTGADDRKFLRVLARHPFSRDRRRGAGPHHRVIGAVANRQGKASLRMRVDQNGKHRRQIELLTIALADRHPFAGRGLRLLDIRWHRFPFAGIFIQYDMAFWIHIVTAFTVHAIRLFDAAHIFRRRHKPHHIGAAEDQCFAVSPALHCLLSLHAETPVRSASAKCSDRAKSSFVNIVIAP